MALADSAYEEPKWDEIMQSLIRADEPAVALERCKLLDSRFEYHQVLYCELRVVHARQRSRRSGLLPAAPPASRAEGPRRLTMLCFSVGPPDSDYSRLGYGYPTNRSRTAAKPCGDA